MSDDKQVVESNSYESLDKETNQGKDFADPDENTNSEQENPSSNLESLLQINFVGAARVKKSGVKIRQLNLDLVQILNANSNKISDEIRNELRSKIPVGIDVTVSIEFKTGSVAWDGFVVVSDFLERVGNTISSTKLIIDTIKIATNKIIRLNIEEQDRVVIEAINTSAKLSKTNRDNINLGTKLLWWCSGAVVEILKNSPTDKAKYQGIGGAILTTGILASLSGGYAFYTVLDGFSYAFQLGIIFALLWGTIIFNIDRSIVVSMRKEIDDDEKWISKFWKELKPTFPRLLLALILGLTISKPLELRLFEGPIIAKVESNKEIMLKEHLDSLQNSNSMKLNSLDNNIKEIENQINTLTNKADESNKQFRGETDGTNGSGRIGYSQVAKIKEKLYSDDLTNLSNYKRDNLKKLNSLKNQREAIIKEINDSAQAYKKTIKTDFLMRLKALSDLRKDPAISWADWGIMAIIILIELTPILVKLLSPLGPYDARLNEREKTEVREAELRRESVIAEAEALRDTKITQIKSRNEIEIREANFKQEFSLKTLESYYVILAKNEIDLNEYLFQQTSPLRKKIIDQKLQEYATFGGKDDGSSFDDLLLNFRKNLFKF